MAEAGGGQRLPRAARITASREIRELFRRGKRTRSRYFQVIFSASPVSHPRLGVVVPRHGRTVVERNRLKRRVREIGRRTLLPELGARGVGIDLMLYARPAAYDASFREVRDDLGRVLAAVEGRWSGASSSG